MNRPGCIVSRNFAASVNAAQSTQKAREPGNTWARFCDLIAGAENVRSSMSLNREFLLSGVHTVAVRVPEPASPSVISQELTEKSSGSECIAVTTSSCSVFVMNTIHTCDKGCSHSLRIQQMRTEPCVGFGIALARCWTMIIPSCRGGRGETSIQSLSSSDICYVSAANHSEFLPSAPSTDISWEACCCSCSARPAHAEHTATLTLQQR